MATKSTPSKSTKVEKAPAEVPEDPKSKVAPSEEGSAHREPVSPPSGSRTVVIEGDGELLMSIRGETRSIPRGVPVEVGQDIMEALEGSSSITFKEVKK